MTIASFISFFLQHKSVSYCIISKTVNHYAFVLLIFSVAIFLSLSSINLDRDHFLVEAKFDISYVTSTTPSNTNRNQLKSNSLQKLYFYISLLFIFISFNRLDRLFLLNLSTKIINKPLSFLDHSKRRNRQANRTVH